MPHASDALQNILKNTDGSNNYKYPTDFTRGIIPKAFHSHNDYWRDVPFYSGLSHGAISTEADVWLINKTIYVGHHPSSLTTSRTFQSLYVDPILRTLALMNPSTPFIQSPTANGVFDTDPGQTLYFFIDFKTGADDTWPAVLSALAPLRDGGWLSEYDGARFIERAVTIIGTGNTPLERVKEMKPRWVFYDGPLEKLSASASSSEGDKVDPEGIYTDLTSGISPIASVNFHSVFGRIIGREFSTKQLEVLRAHVKVAHDKGIKARYWNQPEWPISERNAVWRTLWDEGVDILNVDDLKGAAEFWEGK